MMKQKCRSPTTYRVGRLSLFWLVCHLPARTQHVKGAESTTLALDKLGACWYHVISQNKQLIIYQKEKR